MSTFLYSMLSFWCTMTMFAGVMFLPVASVQCIVQTVNITSGMCLFHLLLKDKADKCVFIAASLCIGGVILVIQPDFIFNSGESSLGLVNSEVPEDNYNVSETMYVGPTSVHENGNNNLAKQILKYMLPIATGLGLTLDVVLLKRRPYLSQNIMDVLFWCFLLNTILSIVPMLVFETPVLPDSWMDILLVVVHCVSYLAMWPLYMFAIQYISGNTFNIISSCTLVFMLIAQYTVLSSILPGHRNWIEIVGVVLVLFGSILGSILELYRSKSKG